jgi:hypothetical protein
MSVDNKFSGILGDDHRRTLETAAALADLRNSPLD